MALAEYFARNAQAAAALVQGFDASLLGARLEAEVIGIAYDASVERNAEGRATLDLSLRILSRLYPTLAIVARRGTTPAYLHDLRALARSINPRIDIEDELTNATNVTWRPLLQDL